MFDGGLSTKMFLYSFSLAKVLLIYKNNKLHEEFYQRVVAGKDYGCFGLTEFHHGSYSKGIETTATYNQATKEFVLSTHGTKGMKFWIGGLG
jgi:acyl-CoA oxidase